MGMSVSCLFTKTSGLPGLLATFILTEGWMGWMGWDGMDGRSTFFFGQYLGNYYIIFFYCFSSLKYMDLHIFWNIRRKKSEYSFFQNISPKSSPTFFSKIFQGFLNFSKTTRYILLIVFGPPRRVIKTSF